MPEVDPSKPIEPSTIPSTSTQIIDSSIPLHDPKIDQKIAASPSIPNQETYIVLWQAKGMDIDNFLLDPTRTTDSMPESSQQHGRGTRDL